VPEVTQVFKRTPSTQNAGWFLDLYDSGKLDLDPPYQRLSVWNPDFKLFFIDSVVRNYPTQAIFLDISLDPDRPTVYRVLDGKQRLTALIEFTSDGFQAPDSLADFRVAGLYYSDFPREVKALILRYLFIVETVSDANTAELNQAFDRLNRNVSRLNKQELRHAQFGGKFITKMEDLANDSFWERIGLVTAARRRRMLDVEYVSEFYAVALSGVQDGKDYLDALYAAHDDEIPNEESTDSVFERSRNFISQLDADSEIASTRFRNVADFYALWCAVVDAVRTSEPLLAAERAAANLGRLADEIEAQETRRARDYLLAARQGSNKASNRLLRSQIIASAIRDTSSDD
jgi:hypothetical protein